MAEDNSAMVLATCGMAVALLVRRRRRNRKERKIWVKQWILGRERQGAYHQLMNELRAMDVSSYRNFLRMDAATFER